MLEAGNLWELIERRAEATPDGRFAVDQTGRATTFAEYLAACERAAAGLQGLGVSDGAVVSWQLPTWIESMVLVGALARLSALQNPILPILREREVGFIVRQARSELLVVPSEFRGFDFEAMARGIASGEEGLEVLVADRQLLEGDPSTLPPKPQVTPDPPVRWLFYTSGTTADPKGAQHTDLTVAAAARGMAERLALPANGRRVLRRRSGPGLVQRAQRAAVPVGRSRLDRLEDAARVPHPARAGRLQSHLLDPAAPRLRPRRRAEGVYLGGSGEILLVAGVRASYSGRVGVRSLVHRFTRRFERFNNSFGRIAATDAVNYPLPQARDNSSSAAPGETEKRGSTEKHAGDN